MNGANVSAEVDRRPGIITPSVTRGRGMVRGCDRAGACEYWWCRGGHFQRQKVPVSAVRAQMVFV
jgi:hypothetical protein